MKKIKSVKLKKDFENPFTVYPKGTKGVLSGNGYNFCNYFVPTAIIKGNQYDFFDITYEEDFFEVRDEKTGYIILGDGTIYDFINNNTCHHRQGNAGTKSEMEYRKMHNETMHYFRNLAEELNGDWRYEVGEVYRTLLCSNGGEFYLALWQNLTCSIKFSDKVTIDQITSRAKPEMLENYKKICQNPY